MNQVVDVSMIGTHSFRKGIASSGTPGGLTAIAIYLRAGWSLGPLQSRYILEGEGGDVVCGRAATGLPVTDVSFSNLPPHIVSDITLSTNEWEDILPAYFTFYPLHWSITSHSSRICRLEIQGIHYFYKEYGQAVY
jgi:hypothetical protein